MGDEDAVGMTMVCDPEPPKKNTERELRKALEVFDNFALYVNEPNGSRIRSSVAILTAVTNDQKQLEKKQSSITEYFTQSNKKN